LNVNEKQLSQNLQDIKDFTDEFNKNLNDFNNSPENVLLELSTLFKTQEFINLERKKILFFFKIYNNLQVFNQNEEKNIFFKNKSTVIFKYFDKRLLMVNDAFNQILILNILALYILKIYGEDITLTTLKYIIRVILKNESFNYSELDIILKMENTYIISYYFELFDHLTTLLKVG